MIHVKKDCNNPPAELTDSKWSNIKLDVLTNSDHSAKSKCYRDTTLNELVKLYSNKCACCERSRGEELQIDHYRPKKARNNKDTTYNNPAIILKPSLHQSSKRTIYFMFKRQQFKIPTFSNTPT